MLRAWFILIIGLGILSSGLSNCSRRAASAPDGFHRVAADHESDLARARRYAEDDQHSTGNALTLHREYDGHFYADTQINGTSIRMLVDTGASGIALSRDDARKAGIGISIGMPNVVAEGAGGDVRGEVVTIDRVALGGETAESVSAVVLDGGIKSLLGQSFLAKFDSVEIRGDTMVLH